ncbi:hypothetical protein FCM35_KLT19146 [Carex littledalei]|uniref:Uncharacterized protein n=1 Tax=Carex littledalei TaxID=544730 RepID=A0A833QW79_9POAL|nr:hypothetical protein FCM35_KLT19146 [Carex littledalei]
MPMVVVRAEQAQTTAIPRDLEQVNHDDKRLVKTATTVLNVVESVAKAVDKVAEDVQRSLPKNSNLWKVAQIVEKIAEEVDKDAEVLESMVEKV